MAERSVRVELEEVVDAMTLGAELPGGAWLDLRTGAVRFDPLEDADVEEDELAEDAPSSYAVIPRIEAREDYEVMRRFAASVDDGDAAVWMQFST